MPNSSPDKIIVSNGARLKDKYGQAGERAVSAAVKKLIKADAGRGLVTRFVDLSDATEMKSFRAAAVPAGDAADASLNKKAIDRVFNAFEVPPAYLMLLGSVDVIPHVPLVNPLAGDRKAGDPDPLVPSDLPYACDKPYSTDVQDFIAPSRVVGRLPNVTNDSTPDYLVRLLNTAATHTSRPAADYESFLAISTFTWTRSSQRSLKSIFGIYNGMKISPEDGFKWRTAEAKRLCHFVNCHGAPADPHFLGQKGLKEFPVSHSARWMASRLSAGTVLAAECCYGAELYDPALPTARGHMGMCNTYLGAGAYACFGSTNTAYGPRHENDQADLMCQIFLQQIVKGASAGRACLQARLNYVQGKGNVLTPTDLKTLAQFTLLADPSVTPVEEPTANRLISMAASDWGPTQMKTEMAQNERQQRRGTLAQQAATTTAYRLKPQTKSQAEPKTKAYDRLWKFAAEHGVKEPVVLTHELDDMRESVERGGVLASRALAAKPPRKIHTLLERCKLPADFAYLHLVQGVLAIEYDGWMDVRAFESR